MTSTDADAQLLNALSLFRQGRSREAEPLLSSALAVTSGPPEAWRLLGDILLVSDRFEAARRAYDRQIWAMIQEPRLKAAAADLAESRLVQADQGLRAILSRQPANLAAAHLIAELFRRQGRLAEAEQVLGQVLARAPQLYLVRQTLALVLFGQGRFEACLTELDRLLAQDPEDSRSGTIKAAALSGLDDHAAAAAVTQALVARFPDQPHPRLLLGHGLRTLGRTAEAVAAYQACIALDPGCGEAWWGLANLKTHRFDNPSRAEMEAQLASGGFGEETRSLIAFSLGKALEDEGAFEAAFARYAEANAIQRRLRPYDADQAHAAIEQTKAVFSPAFLAARAGWGEADPAPIFIVGLPRSGSTLVEQILASHPDVEATRELGDLQMLADQLGSPDAARHLSAADCAVLGRRYLDQTRTHRRLGRPRFLDKAPWNFQHVGLIRLILPEAKIVDVRRHPLACGFSVFKQHFQYGSDFSYDLTDIGRYYADYAALMAHFKAAAPGWVHRLDYEDLVADTEGEVRRLLDYLQLPFEPACLRFFENRRAVATPSSEQVRRPIYADALDQWRLFEPWLQPLKDALDLGDQAGG